MAQLRLLLVTVAGMVVVMTSVPVLTEVISACTCAPEENPKENIAKLAGKMFDRQREVYCKRFATSGVDTGAWPTILTNCFGQLAFDDSNPYLRGNLPKVSKGMIQVIKDIYNRCSSLVSSSPCKDSKGWKQLKNCSRQIFMKEDVLSSGQPDDALPENMRKLSLDITFSIFKCTAAHLGFS